MLDSPELPEEPEEPVLVLDDEAALEAAELLGGVAALLAALALLLLVPAIGANGLCATPWRCTLGPLVVSEEAGLLGAWLALIVRPWPVATGGEMEAVGVLEELLPRAR